MKIIYEAIEPAVVVRGQRAEFAKIEQHEVPTDSGSETQEVITVLWGVTASDVKQRITREIAQRDALLSQVEAQREDLATALESVDRKGKDPAP